MFSESDRRLPGNVINGVHIQFEAQSKLALSISHFLSSFYQIINTEEDFPLTPKSQLVSLFYGKNVTSSIIFKIIKKKHLRFNYCT